MCGRYVSSGSAADLVEEFGVRESVVDADLPPDYNVAPTKPVYVVLERASGGEPGGPAGGIGAPNRQLRLARWGLVPSWANDPSIGNRLINARAETLADKPAFRKAFATRRCLLPADGFYEWRVEDGLAAGGPAGRPRKQPWFIRPADGGSLAMAGLYELWRDRVADDEWLWSVAVVTTDATDDVGHIHERMPMLVKPKDWSAWLDPAGTGDLADLLAPARPDRLTSYRVSTAVNNVRNNGAGLVVPV